MITQDGVEALSLPLSPRGIEPGKKVDLMLKQESAGILVRNPVRELPPARDGVRGRLEDGEAKVIELGEAAPLQLLVALDDHPVVAGGVDFDMRVAAVARDSAAGKIVWPGTDQRGTLLDLVANLPEAQHVLRPPDIGIAPRIGMASYEGWRILYCT